LFRKSDRARVIAQRDVPNDIGESTTLVRQSLKLIGQPLRRNNAATLRASRQGSGVLNQATLSNLITQGPSPVKVTEERVLAVLPIMARVTLLSSNALSANLGGLNGGSQLGDLPVTVLNLSKVFNLRSELLSGFALILHRTKLILSKITTLISSPSLETFHAGLERVVLLAETLKVRVQFLCLSVSDYMNGRGVNMALIEVSAYE